MTIQVSLISQVNFRGNSRRITPVMAEIIRSGLLQIESDAKQRATVDVGRFRSSIHHSVESSVSGLNTGIVLGRVWIGVSYGPFVEYGTGQIGKRTALAQGVIAPDWYQYGPQFGHWVPLAKSPGLIKWLQRVAGYKIVPVAGHPDRFDVFYKGTNSLVRRATKYWHVSGKAQPALTPALMRHQDGILNRMRNINLDG